MMLSRTTKQMIADVYSCYPFYVVFSSSSPKSKDFRNAFGYLNVVMSKF
jgi:hypothetical protein